MQSTSVFGFSGGLDLTSAALAVPPGRLIGALNYEPLAEGYGRVPGYERFDGRPLASKALFSTLAFDAGGLPLITGQTITGRTSGATALILLDPVDATGSWDAGTAAGLLVLDSVTGTFVNNEIIDVLGAPHAFVNGVLGTDSASTEERRHDWTLAATEAQRARIFAVPGQGPVRGVAMLDGIVYAWRDQNDTFSAMFKATSAGWASITGSWRLNFTAGNVELTEGQVVNQSGPSATVRRVVRNSGSYGDGTAAGYIVVSGVTGTFAAGALKNAGATTVATVGPIEAVKFNAGGRYDFIGHNFYGAANRYRLYGAYSVGKAFETDGTYVVPIDTGMTVDAPTRVAEVGNHLLLTFPGGSLQFSGTGDPLAWEVIVGAGEIGLGTEVTDLVQSNATTVAVFGVKKVAILVGTDAESFQLDELSEEAGAEPWTAKAIGQVVYLDRRGLRTLSATQAYGNFKTGTLTELVAPLLTAQRAAGALPVLSLVSKTKSQYRLYWDDGTGLSVYMGRKTPEAIPFSLGDMRPYCGIVGELDDGTEGIFVGAEDGYVYRMDSGPSFDGVAIDAFAMLPFNHLGSLAQNKRFHGVAVEMVSAPDTSIGIAAQFDYSDGGQPNDNLITGGGGGAWGNIIWNEFFWSAPYAGVAAAPIDGFGRNISLLISADSDELEAPHILQAYKIVHSPRGAVRYG